MFYKALGDVCEAVEAFEPSTVEWSGIRFLGRRLTAVAADLHQRAIRADIDPEGLLAADLGVALTAPDEGDRLVQGILVHEKGYFD